MILVATILAVGMVLILLEMLLPGLVAGIIGVICIIVGVSTGFARFGPEKGLWILLTAITLLLIIGALWLKIFPKSRYAQTLISRRSIGTVGGEQKALLHEKGQAFTNLRPSGTALIQGKRVDVITEGPHILKGAAIEVVAIEGMRVVVRAV